MRKEIKYYFEYVYPEIHYLRNNPEHRKLKLFKGKNCLHFFVSKVLYCLMSSFFRILNIFENIFFFKTEYFKNNTKGKNLFVKAIWTTFIILTLAFFMRGYMGKYEVDKRIVYNFELKDITYFVAIFMGVYWNARSVFTKKWDYAAALFNKLCFELPIKKYPDRIAKLISVNFMQSTLSLDLLTLEIWSHKSFYSSFEESVYNAIAYQVFITDFEAKGHIDISYIKSRVKSEYSNTFSGEVKQYSKISALLSAYQEDLSNYVIHNNYI